MLQKYKQSLGLIILSCLLLPNLALAQVTVKTTQPNETNSVILRVPLEETESDLITNSDLNNNNPESETSPQNTEEPLQSFDLKFNEELSITEELQGKNLYAFAADLGIYQPIKGDLISAAGSLTIDSDIEEDAFLAAGDIYLNAKIKGDLRAVAGDINISGEVNGDFMVAAGTVHLTPKSKINGDGIINAGSVIIEGPINGNLTINANHIEIASQITGDLKLNADSIEFSEEGQVTGNLNYSSTQKIDRLDKVVSGEVKFFQFELPNTNFGQIKLTPFKLILKLLFGILSTLVLTLIFAKHLTKLAKLALKEPGMKMVLGITVLVSTPIMALMLLFTFIATPLSALLILLYGLIIILAHYLNAIFFGSFLMKRLKEQKNYQFTLLSSALGFVTIELIEQIPVAGHIAEFLLLFLTLGTISNYLFNGLDLTKKK